MPNRIIRESCRTSLSLSKLSHGAERLFWRLLTCADDFGRVQADPELIQAACFPRNLLSIQVSDVRTFRDELIAGDMLVLYSINGNEYAYFTNWDKWNKKRSKFSKYPEPPTSICKHMPASADIREHMSASAHLIEKREARSESRETTRDGGQVDNSAVCGRTSVAATPPSSPMVTHVTGSNGRPTSAAEIIKRGDELVAKLRAQGPAVP